MKIDLSLDSSISLHCNSTIFRFCLGIWIRADLRAGLGCEIHGAIKNTVMLYTLLQNYLAIAPSIQLSHPDLRRLLRTSGITLMASWDDDDFEPTTNVVAARANFDDEEEDEGVLDSWDAPSEDESKPAPVVATKKKGTLKDALKRREEENAAEEAARIEQLANAAPAETPAERRERLKAAEMRSDLNNAADLFGAAHITEADKTLLKSQIKGATLSDILEPRPQTKDDFASVVAQLAQGIKELSNDRQYAQFIQDLTKALCEPLSAEDTKKIQTSLNVMVNAKNLAEKGGPAKKKKAAAKPGLAKMGAQTSAYTRSLDTNRLDDDYDE